MKKKTNLEQKDNKYIIVKNSEGESNTVAYVLIKGEINFVPKVSVIIVINNQEYFIKFMENIMNQTLKEIEIILIDDGSIYNSLGFVKKYRDRDKRITLIRLENFHGDISRNAGLSIAKGKYLNFVELEYSYELNMLEEMYEKISKTESDIIICQSTSIGLDKQFNQQIYNNLRMELIPNKAFFTKIDISKNFFQIFGDCISDKLFNREFILFNNIKFQSVKNFNAFQFIYSALLLSNSITVKNKILVKQIYENKRSLSFISKRDFEQLLLLMNKIKSYLQKAHLYNLLKGSFRIMIIKLFINQLKLLEVNSKQYFYNILHKKLNLWSDLDYSQFSSNIYKALHYAKYQKNFPTINILYIIDGNYLKVFLISIISVLINSEYENINFIVFYNNINPKELKKINELKYIRFFTAQIMNISDKYCKNNPYLEIGFFLNVLYKISNIDKVLYIRMNTIIRKSLLPLWEINMNNILISGVEDILLFKCKDQSKDINLIDNLCINNTILLINIIEWKKKKLHNNLFVNDIINEAYKSNRNNLNIKRINLNLEFNYMKFMNLNFCKIDSNNLRLYREKDPDILLISKIKFNISVCKNFITNEIFKYNRILKFLNNILLNIPIVLSSDNKYAPYLYTTMVSILENQYKNTYYSFYILVPSNFSKIYENDILKLNDKYKCYIRFIYIKKIFENLIMKIKHITFPTYYRLLISDVLPKEIDKCIYLDIDLCIIKDLSKLFNIDIKENYIAGVLSPKYYLYKEKHCKRLNLSSMNQYINAGMLLMNLKKIRKDNMTQKFIKLIEKNFSSQDQDILNVACYGKILTLKPKYNSQIVRLIEKNNTYLKDLYERKDINQAKFSPYIIHFSDKKKPWNSVGIYLEKFWLDIAKKTPYFNSFITRREIIYKNEIKKFYFKKKKKKLNIDKPLSFNEKIQWLKLHDSTPIKTRLTDKYLVREWIIGKIGEEYLIPLLGVYDSFNDIDFKKLPNQFVIKFNRGEKYNIIVKNKTHLNLVQVESKIEGWMNENYAYINGLELQYRDIQPKIIIEKYMNDSIDDLKNYKFICFNGEPKYILIDDDKKYTKKNGNLYDLNLKENDKISLYIK